MLKILSLSAIIVLVFNIWDNLLNANYNSNKTATNSNTFKKANNSELWNIGVAIWTNIWIRYKQQQSIPSEIYKEVFSIAEVLSNESEAKGEIIWKNMINIREYRNILKTDVKQLINSSYNKSWTLNAFIDQLEFRYTNASESLRTLVRQNQVLTREMELANSKIETLKIKITSDFKNDDAIASLENIDEYLELKKQYYYARTYIIYLNHFTREYNYLNNYNKLLLDTLIQ